MECQSSIPTFDLTDAERTYLQAVYERFLELQRVKPRLLVPELGEQVPADFDPEEMDQRLLARGAYITLLGVVQVDSDTPLLEYCDRVARYLKSRAQNEWRIRDIDVQEIMEVTDLDQEQVSMALHMLTGIETLVGGGSGRGGRGEYMLYRTFRFHGEDQLKRVASYDGIGRELARYAEENHPNGWQAARREERLRQQPVIGGKPEKWGLRLDWKVARFKAKEALQKLWRQFIP